MSNQTILASIITAITLLLIIERVHCQDENETDTEKFICQQVITDIDSCMSTSGCSMEKVKMLAKCNQNYTNNEAIRKKCEELPTEGDQWLNQLLITPVVNTKKNLLYWNMYCAICNFDDEFQFNTPALELATIYLCKINYDFQMYMRSDLSKYFRALLLSEEACYIPEFLLTDDYYCNTTSNISKLYDATHHIPRQYYNFRDLSQSKICPKSPFRSSKQTCNYGSDVGQLCEYSVFLHEGLNFAYGDNGDIYAQPLLFSKKKFLPHEYSNQTGIDGVIFLCGQENSNMNGERITFISVYSFSIIFFMVVVIVSSRKQYLKSLHNRTLYSFCVTRVLNSIVHLQYYFAIFDGWCVLAFFIILWIAVCSLLWLSLVVFEYGLHFYNLIHNRPVPTKVQTKKYLIYCLICWILPAIPTAIAMFIVLLDYEKPPPCPIVGGYSLISCEFRINSIQYPVLFEILNKILLVYLVVVTLGPLTTTFIKIHHLWEKTKTISDSRLTYFLKCASIMFVMVLYLAFFWYYRVALLSLFFERRLDSTAKLFFGAIADSFFFLFFSWRFKESV